MISASFWRVSLVWCALLFSAVLLPFLFTASDTVAHAAPQVRAVNMVMKQATGRVLFCVTKDAMIVAATDGGGGADSRPPAIIPIGAGRVAAVLGAADWIRDNGKPAQIDEELPVIARRVMNATGNAKPLDQSTTDIESIGVSLLEFLRPMINDIHYKLDVAPNEPLVEVLLAGYTEGYGPEIWDIRYRIQQQNLGPDYWETRAMRPSYTQLYPPEKGQPRTFIEAQYPAKLAPLALTRAAQSDPQIGRIRGSSQGMNEAVMSVANGESAKAATKPVEDFLRLALPTLAGAQAKIAVGALDQAYHFQWLLAPEDARSAPAETNANPVPPGQQTQTDRPSLRRAGPPTTQ